MGLLTFSRGGVHPPENKLSAGKKIEFAGLPEQVVIPITQHLGAPAKVLVAKGDEVKTGQLIAQSEGFISTNIHSSVTGKVLKIDDFPDSSGYRRPAVQIQVAEDQWAEGIDTGDELLDNIEAPAEEIRKKFLAAGVVGLGGATFPSHVKLMTPKGKKAEYVIINGVECEPYLTADHALMMEKSKELVVGIKILMKGLGVEKAIVGIENNKPDAIEKMTAACSSESN
ncbi:MAG: electron transporter RnfC, partial [Bacteroidales bacterium]|nr:electron transporter RnfC [Bacteroidales bacterium]